MFGRSHKLRRGILVISLVLAGVAPAISDQGVLRLNRGWKLRSSALVSEDGPALTAPDYRPQDWYSTAVPTTVLRALVQNGVYPDPYVDMNNMKIPDASEEFNARHGLNRYSHLPERKNPWRDPYWFWVRFRLPAAWKGKRCRLHLNGLNYRADIWLNGRLIADSRQVVGMFGKWTFDVTDAVQTDGDSTLAIKVHPLDEPGLPGEPQLRAFGDFGLNGGETGDIGKNVTMQSSVGWDWIPAVRDRNMGLWQDVSLSAVGDVDIRFPVVRTNLAHSDAAASAADVSIETEVVNLSSLPSAGEITLKIRSKHFEDPPVSLSRRVELSGNQSLIVRWTPDLFPALRFAEPHLWWPVGYGPPSLYELSLEFHASGIVLDTESVVFGIRDVSSRTTRIGEWSRRDFFVNGRKILLRGGAWVPDMMLARTPEKLRAELRLLREANLNLVRIWGGGVTPPEEFFAVCDELGLCVWHDFWITGDCQGTWGKGSQDYPLDAKVFLSNAVDTVLSLRNHPSLVVWTAGNEGLPRREIYVPLRNDILACLDGTRPFIPSSGYRTPPEDWGLSWPDNAEAGTYSGGPYWWVDPRDYYARVKGGKDWLFKNEVGLPSVPPADSLRTFITDPSPDPDILFPLNHVWGYHDACEGNGKYTLYDGAVRRRYGEPVDLEDYALKAQLINAESYKAIFEAVNQSMATTAGVLLWKANPAWPSVSWQLYDWYLRPNAGYYTTKKACEPLHVQLDLEDLSVCVVNIPFMRRERLTVTAAVYDLSMTEVWTRTSGLEVGPASSLRLFPLEIPRNPDSGIVFVKLRLLDESGTVVSDNFYWLSEAGDFTALSELPRAALDVHRLDHSEDSFRAWTFRLKNPSSHLAFFINPRLRNAGDGEEILPAFWSDNYFSLLPGEDLLLQVEIPRSSIDGADVVLQLDGWNITPYAAKVEDIRDH